MLLHRPPAVHMTVTFHAGACLHKYFERCLRGSGYGLIRFGRFSLFKKLRRELIKPYGVNTAVRLRCVSVHFTREVQETICVSMLRSIHQ